MNFSNAIDTFLDERDDEAVIWFNFRERFLASSSVDFLRFKALPLLWQSLAVVPGISEESNS